MPVGLSTLSHRSLRALAADCNVDSTGLDKQSLFDILTTLFEERGFDVQDISSVSVTKQTKEPPTTQSELYLPSAPSRNFYSPAVIQLPPPPNFDVREEDRARRFSLWLEEFESYVAAVGELDVIRKKALILYCAGPEFKRLIESHKLKDLSYDALIVEVEKKFTSPSTLAFNRFKLSEMHQQTGEGIEDYLSRLRSQARFCGLECPSCNFSLVEARLFDIILKNTNMPTLRTRIFERGIITLSDLLTAASNLQVASRQSAQMSRPSTPAIVVDAVNRNQKPFRHSNDSKKSVGPGTPNSNVTIRCKFCDTRHIRDKEKCPALKLTCSKCGGRGHFAICCNRRFQHTKSLKALTTDMSFSYSLGGEQHATVQIRIYDVMRVFYLDTGATENIVPSSFVKLCSNLQPAPDLICYSGARIKPLGRMSVPVTLPDGSSKVLDCVVVKKGKPLLGLQSCLNLGFVSLGASASKVNHVSFSEQRTDIKIASLLRKYKDLFSATPGCVKGVKAHIELKQNARSKFMRHRCVPLALREKVSSTLDDMVSRGTLSPVKTSEWASPIVVVPKPDNSVRICADYTATLASIVDTEAYPLPHPEELFSSLAGKSIFSKLDLRTCFEQFELDESSKTFLTINTHRGLFQYQRLPYGISSAPAIVQRAMEELTRGLDVLIYMDDMLLASENERSHLELLDQVFSRLKDANLRLKKEKCMFLQSEIKYLGFIVSAQGRLPDPEKVGAIQNMPSPTSVHDVRSFLGLIRFYDKFVPSLSELAKPLYDLLKKDAKFKWSSSQHQAFSKLKEILSSSICLCHYDPDKHLVLATDASPTGVSAILSHRMEGGQEKPIAYASRLLGPSETRYAQIDLEALAIVYGVKKFSSYLLGRSFTLVTDHQPLQAIFGNKKGIPALATARLHRYAVFLMSYNFNVEYRKGILNGNADALSRAPVDRPVEDLDETEIFLISNISSAPLNSELVATETSNDTILSQVMQFVRSGWPSNKPSDLTIQAYWSRRKEISVQGDILLWGQRVIIPSVVQREVIKELHVSHSGIVNMKSLARQYVWWPTINQDIESFVQSCDMCALHASSPTQVTHSWPASEVWTRIHLDYASFRGQNILILVDSGSKWMEARIMKSTTTEATLRTIYYWFTRFGFPLQIHTDGGPQFTSEEFRRKLDEWGVTHTISPPYHPSSNGTAERAVRTLKGMLKKGVSLEQALFQHRATPVNGTSPAESLTNRRLRTRLSSVSNSKFSQFSQTAKPHRFDSNDRLWVRDFRLRSNSKWQPAKCVEVQGRTVVIAVAEDGTLLRRHINHVRKRP